MKAGRVGGENVGAGGGVESGGGWGRRVCGKGGLLGEEVVTGGWCSEERAARDWDGVARVKGRREEEGEGETEIKESDGWGEVGGRMPI